MAKRRKGKKVSYQLIERKSDVGSRIYPLLDELVEAHHEELRDARIALAWNLSWQPDVDGRVILGKCKKASDLDRELAAFDFVIILRKEFFQSLSVSVDQRTALLDHELCHATVTLDKDGDPLLDERGRIVFRTRKHDLEEFSEIVERYGCWKKDLEAFASALERANTRSERQWVGFQRLHESLSKAGVALSLDTVVGWNEAERREAARWVALREELGTSDVLPPAHIAAVIDQPVPPQVDETAH